MNGCPRLKQASEGASPAGGVVIETWVGVIVGSFVLAIAATLVTGHYRREHLRERMLRRMEHLLGAHAMRRRP
jgi:hypothetical protein